MIVRARTLALALLFAARASASLQASALFSDGLVLQTTDDDGPGAKISGTASPNAKIDLKSDPARITATTTADSKGDWILTVNATSGGPYNLMITSEHQGNFEHIQANDVLFGDVYLCSGVSLPEE